MSHRIGGEFGIEIDHFLQPSFIQDKRKYQKRYQLYLDTGRSALYIALIDIIRRGGLREAWLPRYCCESVILPFQQLGFKLHFYSMGEDLETPDLLPDSLKGATFLFIHYFGKKNYEIIKWIKNLWENGSQFFLVEDCVQAALSENVGELGDYVVYSYRKFLPQPDGAVLASDFQIPCSLLEPDEEFISKKLTGKIIREYNGDDAAFLKLFSEAEAKIDLQIEPRKMSWLSQFLFKKINLNQVKEKRINNWSYLIKQLRITGILDNHLYLIYSSLSEGEVPLGLPIRVETDVRNELRKFLFQQNIFCPIHWVIDEKANKWNGERKLSASILTLPIDQRISESSLDYLVEKLSLYFKGNKK